MFVISQVEGQRWSFARHAASVQCAAYSQAPSVLWLHSLQDLRMKHAALSANEINGAEVIWFQMK